jgi:predicted ATPase
LHDFASSSSLQRGSSGSIRSIQTLSSSHSNSVPGQQKSFAFEKIRSAIVEQLGLELALLTTVIPSLEELVRSMDTSQGTFPAQERFHDKEGSDNGGVFEATNRLHYAFCRFIQVVATFSSSWVLVLDNLQWADLASIDLMEVLVSDCKTINLVLVCCF